MSLSAVVQEVEGKLVFGDILSHKQELNQYLGGWDINICVQGRAVGASTKGGCVQGRSGGTLSVVSKGGGGWDISCYV